MTTPTGPPPNLATVRTAARTADLACWRIDTAWQCLHDAYGPGGRATAASDAMWLAGNHLRRVAELLSSHRTGQRYQGTAWLAVAVAVAVTTHLHTIPVPIAAAIGYAAGIGTTTLIRQTARAWHRYRLAAIPTTGPYQPAVRYAPGCIGSIRNQIHAAQHEVRAAIELTDRLRLALPTPAQQTPNAAGSDHLDMAGRHANSAHHWLAIAAARLDDHATHARSL